MMKTILMYEIFKLIKNLNSTVTKPIFILYVKFMVLSPGVCSCVCSACMYMDASTHVQGWMTEVNLGCQYSGAVYLVSLGDKVSLWNLRLTS